MSPTVGCARGALAMLEGSMPGPADVLGGGVVGRGVVRIPFHGHIESSRLWPTRVAPASPSLPRNVYVPATVGFQSLFRNCHWAQSRSTLQCRRKKSGSRGAVAGLLIGPLKHVCARPCGCPSMRTN